MTGPAPVRSHLGRLATREPLTREELDLLRARAWRDHGIVVVMPAELADDWLRQGITQHANKAYGRRMKR